MDLAPSLPSIMLSHYVLTAEHADAPENMRCKTFSFLEFGIGVWRATAHTQLPHKTRMN